MRVPDLRTARLLLRPVTLHDAPAIATGVGNRAVAEWLTRVPHPYVLDDAHQFIAGVLARDALAWVIDDGAVAGIITLGDELGYWVGQDRWGRGLATEAARAVLSWHFSDGAGDDVPSGHFADNLRSRAVLLKQGFRDIGERRLPCPARGYEVKSIAMRLTRADFRAATAP